MRDCGPRDWKRARNEEAMEAADGSGVVAVEKRRLGENREARRTGRRVMVKLYRSIQMYTRGSVCGDSLGPC